jgi:hypothetical protein
VPAAAIYQMRSEEGIKVIDNLQRLGKKFGHLDK